MMEFVQPPPNTNFNVPPPAVQNATTQQPHNQSPSVPHYQRERHSHYHGGFSGKSSHFRSYNNFRGSSGAATQDDFDGKRLRKSVMRKTVDYNSSIVRALEVISL